MSASKTAKHIANQSCEECGRAVSAPSEADRIEMVLDPVTRELHEQSTVYEEPVTGRSLCLDCWQEGNALCADCEEPFPHSELNPDEAARANDPGNLTEAGEFYCPGCIAARPGTTASKAAAKTIDGIGAGLRAAIEREAMWQSTLRENYGDDFGAWLAYSDMYGLAGRLGFTTAEDAWEANPTIQGSTDPRDFKVVPAGEPMDIRVDAALGWDPCEDCGSNEEPCDCRRRAEAKPPTLKAPREAIIYEPAIRERLREDFWPKVRCSQCGATRLPEKMEAGSDGKRVCLNGCRIIREPSTMERVKKFIGLSHRVERAFRAAREMLDMGDLVIKESPPSMGGLDVYRKGPGYAEDRGDLEKVTFLNERGMEELGEWITNAARVARRIATTAYFVGEVFMPGLRTDPRHEGRMGHVVIGGDRGDVWATSAHADEKDSVEGVTLVDVEFRTTLDFSGIGSDELREEAEHVIQGSYDSVQEDTFMPTRSAARYDRTEMGLDRHRWSRHPQRQRLRRD